MEHIHEIPMTQVHIIDEFWGARQRLMTDVTIPYMEQILCSPAPGEQKTDALSNFRIAAGEAEGAFNGIVFQDSDVYKWLEAVAYSLVLKPDAALEARLDDVTALIGRAQQPDGYLHTYFTVKEPQNRWENLLECHELYCAGHLLEAAAALYEADGKDALLKIAVRLADHIIQRFGENGREGLPGHQEIEIGLLRLYHVTGESKYRDMALRFLNLRGQEPDWFEKHTPPHPGRRYGDYDIDPRDTAYNQSDVPVRAQTKARGHAVRLLYMLTAMADAAAVTKDEMLKRACETMFDNITRRQIYVTGALGSSAHHEAFTDDFDLPGDRAYGETCAAVSMAFFSNKMLQMEPDGRYADMLERELYNGALSGMQLNGERFFYVNPLEAVPGVSGCLPGYQHVCVERPKWLSCACCPPNLARLLSSLGKYLWSEDDTTVYSHLFIGNEAQTSHAAFKLETGWPWRGEAVYTVTGVADPAFTLAIHMPDYVKEFTLTLNGERLSTSVERGYARIRRVWREGDCVAVGCDLTPRRVYADPRVRDAAGKVALALGPVIYCFESTDNGPDLSALRLPRTAVLNALPFDSALLCGVVPLEMEGMRSELDQRLYSADAPFETRVSLRAVPYYAWSNRGAGEMRVWIRE